MALQSGSADSPHLPRLLVPLLVLAASVGACSVMPPADAGTPVACRAEPAAGWVGRAASADVVEQARVASRSETVRLLMPGDADADADEPRPDRLDLRVDARGIIVAADCGWH